MSTRTLTALFDSHAEAERGRQRLAQIGVSPGTIEIMDQAVGAQAAQSSWEKFKHMLMPESERSEYEEGIRRGGSLLTASVDDSLTERTVAALEECHPIDLRERAAEWRKSGWSSPPQSTAGSGRIGSDGSREEVIPVAEEQLRVGKRQVERGGVRVRAYVVEQPVQEDVRLRECGGPRWTSRTITAASASPAAVHRRVGRAGRPVTDRQKPSRRRESAGGAGRPEWRIMRRHESRSRQDDA